MRATDSTTAFGDGGVPDVERDIERFYSVARANGKWHVALDEATRLLDVRVEDVATSARRVLLVGCGMFEADRPATAERYFTRARLLLRDVPDRKREYVTVLMWLARAREAQGKRGAAWKSLREALALFDAGDIEVERVRDLTRSLAYSTGSRVRAGTGTPRQVRSTAYGRLTSLPWSVALSPSTTRLLGEAQEQLGRLDEVAHRSDLGFEWAWSVQLREIQCSAHLDGLHVALREVFRTQLPGVSNRVGEAGLVPYLRASRRALAHGTDVTVETLHGIATAYLRDDGRSTSWRQSRTSDGCDPETRLRRLVEWSQRDSPIPVVARMALAYCYLWAVGPFQDGNDHIARLYLGMELTRLGVLRGHWLPIAGLIGRARQQYRKNLGQAGRSGDVGPFIDFFARAVVDTCRAEIRLIDEVTFTRECLTNAPPPDSHAALRHVVASVAALPVINNQRVAERYRLTAKSAATVTDALASRGVLVRMDDTGNPGQAYSCPSVLDLFVRHGQRNNSVHYGPISGVASSNRTQARPTT